MMAFRCETDSLGSIDVPADHLWGAQTQRSLQHFPIGQTRFRWQRPMLRALGTLKHAAAKAACYQTLVKTGRTHLQDAAPITLGQEISAWVAQLNFGLAAIHTALPGLFELAIGGTAVGTGLNTHPRFGTRVAHFIGEMTGYPFGCAANRFFALAAHDAVVQVSAALRTLAGGLFKLANDIRWLASGPHCGIGELKLPENEPGSSIMPGKVNPTQCEALSMVCVQVFGHDAAIAFAGSQGHFQLNTYKPIIAHLTLESIGLVAEACDAFTTYCARGIEPNLATIAEHLDKNLMLVTALSRHIGYDKAAEIAKKAHHEGLSLREAAVTLGGVSEAQLTAWLNPLMLTQPASD